MNGAGNEVFGLCRGCRNDVKAKQPSLFTEKKKKKRYTTTKSLILAQDER